MIQAVRTIRIASQGPAGPAGLYPQGSWHAGKTPYKRATVLAHDGGLWLALRDTSVEPGHGVPDDWASWLAFDGMISGFATLDNGGRIPLDQVPAGIPNSKLAHPSLTVAGRTVALGGSQALAASDLSNGVTGSGAIMLATAPTVSGTLTAGGVAASGGAINGLTVFAGAQLTVGSGGGAVTLTPVGSGKLVFETFTTGAFSMMLIGGTTSASPALKKSGATLQARRADDSGDAAFQCGHLKATGAQIDFTGLPASDPHVAGRLWSNAGVLTVSAG